MTHVAESKIDWTDELKRVYAKYPACIRSSAWPEIVAAANGGKPDLAMQLAKDHQASSKSVKAENVLARKLRIERMALFALQADAEDTCQAIFRAAANTVSAAALRDARPDALRPVLRSTMATVRRQLRKWLTDAVWDSILLGFKNINDAVRPILADNQESAQDLAEVDLIEERLSFGVKAGLAGRAGVAQVTSDKWRRVMDRIYKEIVGANNKELDPSERIWQMTNASELAMRRILSQEVSQGSSAREIAKRLQDYLNPDVAVGAPAGPGVYSNPFKNAMRLARTESSRAFTKATASWAAGKSWVAGVRATLSGAHKDEDECDDNAGKLFTPDEFESRYPLHPHCMCYGVIVIKDEFLTDIEDAA